MNTWSERHAGNVDGGCLRWAPAGVMEIADETMGVVRSSMGREGEPHRCCRPPRRRPAHRTVAPSVSFAIHARLWYRTAGILEARWETVREKQLRPSHQVVVEGRPSCRA